MAIAAITITLEIVSLIAAGVSIGLAFFAIVLSLIFFFMSHKAASRMENSVNVQRELFDRMYSDTFSLNRDMVRDLQNRNPQSADDINTQIEDRVTEKTEVMKREYEGRVTELLSRLETSEENVASFQAAARQIIDSAVEESRQIASEVRNETLREYILSLFLVPGMGPPRVLNHRELDALFRDTPWHMEALVEIHNMIGEGLVSQMGPSMYTLTAEGLHRARALRVEPSQR